MALLNMASPILSSRNWKVSPFLWLVIAALLFSPAQDLPAQIAATEYQIKAVFLFNFTQFVDWPENAFSDAQTSLVIGVLGDDPFGAYLDETVRGERVKDRPLVVQRYRRVGEIKTCHVLFISRSESARLDQILASLRGRNILTVGDIEGFARRGGMMRFLTQGNKTRLRVNLEAAKAANLTISSKLLRPANVVGPGQD